MRIHYWLILLLLGVSACGGNVPQIVLIEKGKSDFSIVVPVAPSKIELKSAQVLQDYIKRVSGKLVPIGRENDNLTPSGIYIGLTKKAGQIIPGKLPAESYRLQVVGNNLVICGGSGRGLIYGVYSFIEKYLGCRKIANAPAIVTKSDRVAIPGDLKESWRPNFLYRESYYPAARDPEYLEWNKLQQLEDLWGLWGHSYNKLVPAQTYFKSHPEYYALVKGERQPTQLCLSNEDVYTIASSELRKRITANPDAFYWSVSPNDDIGYCECDKCSAVDKKEGSPAASLIKFVNRIAEEFPDNNFTTLAYGYTHKAPKTLKPASNVYVFLSNIDAYRDKPLITEGSAASFRKDVREWKLLTNNLFVWDYITQFTNYLAPFPNLLTLQPNMQYFKENGIKGVFEQGSGDTYGEWAELRSYLIANLFEDETANVKELTEHFLSDFYGPAAKFLLPYIGQLDGNMSDSKRKLDIYGNPVNEWNSYLSPENLDAYSELFDAAEGAVGDKPVYAERVMRARLPLEYTVLQQARFYGIEKFGVFVKDNSGKWIVKPGLKEKVARFVANCKKAKVLELSEGGLSPDQYQAEWNEIFASGVTPTMAIGSKVSFAHPYSEYFPAKGDSTLVDGTPGYRDFSYNWLCFYGDDMVATIDMGKPKTFYGLKMHFLDDPRHWIFLPTSITVEVSLDGNSYTPYASIPTPENYEHYELTVKQFAAEAKAKARYIRVTAKNLPALPEWRFRERKKPMIACDEVYVQ